MLEQILEQLLIALKSNSKIVVEKHKHCPMCSAETATIYLEKESK